MSVHAVVEGLVIAAGVYAVAVVALIVAGRGSAAQEVASLIPNLARLFKGLARDPRVPRSSKVLVVLAVAWIVSPIDLIPEFIPVLGPLDDAVVAALVLRHLLRTIDRETVLAHWRGDPATIERLMRIFDRRPEIER
jgi:uncharacterized membrane protein YkvA (DUF1232 family)